MLSSLGQTAPKPRISCYKPQKHCPYNNVFQYVNTMKVYVFIYSTLDLINSIDYLKKHHQSKKRSSTQSSNNTTQDKSDGQRQRSQSRSCSSQNTQGKLSHSQCFGCGHSKHVNRSDCPAMGKVCHKCGCENHLKVFVAESLSLEEDLNREGESKLMNLNNRTPL